MRRAVLAMMLMASQAMGAAIGSSFTFQGRLDTTNGPANGPHDFQVTLWDEPTGGSFWGGTSFDAWPVSNGLFTVDLDYGREAFKNGGARWIEVVVRNSTNTTWSVLSPRTRVAPAPVAMLATEVADGSVGTAKIASGAVGTSALADGGITAVKIGSGAVGSLQLADGSVTTPKIADTNVTAAKLANGAVTAPAIAAGAVNGLHITNGAIGSSQLAANSISSSKIVDGSIVAGDLAPGIVGEAQLAHPYRAGILGFAEDTWIGPSLVVTQSFAPAFSSVPVIAANLEPATGDDPERLLTLRLSQRSASGFVARISSPQVVHLLQDSFDSSWAAPNLLQLGSGTNARPAIVGGRQADFGNAYRWLAPAGQTGTWTTVLIATNCTVPLAWTDADGWPAAVLIHTWYGQLRFTRAGTELGAQWGALVAPDNATTNVNSFRPAQVQSRPAVVYQGEVGGAQQFRFVRASDTNGAGWGTPVVLKSGAAGTVHALFTVQSNPAALFVTTGGLYYVRSADAQGAVWPAPTLLVPKAVEHASAQIVNGRPAIAYYVTGETNIFFLRASDATGSAWPAPVAATACSTIGTPRPDLSLANGRPLLVFTDYTQIRTAEALNADGTLWNASTEFHAPFPGSLPLLSTALRYAGGLAVLVDHSSGTDSRLIWSGGPPPASLQWTAVQP